MTPNIAGAGIACMDYIVKSPAVNWGDTALVSDYSMQVGGLVAMALITCRKLGANCEMITLLGDDDTGDAVTREISDEGISVSGVFRIPGADSPFSFIHVEETSGERTIFHRSGKGLITPSDSSCLNMIDKCSVLLIDDIYMQLSASTAEYARSNGITVVADMIPDRSNSDLMRYVDILIAPRHFLKSFESADNIDAALDYIHSLGPATAVITLGSDGYAYSSGCIRGAGNAFKVNAVDTTGAGDVFHGAFAYGIAMLWDIPRCAEFASAVAAIKCIGTGPAAIPSLEQTLEFLKQNGSDIWQST
ncbi:MAG: carbohydrate kinase family protein [Armatimonadota bacterium]